MRKYWHAAAIHPGMRAARRAVEEFLWAFVTILAVVAAAYIGLRLLLEHL